MATYKTCPICKKQKVNRWQEWYSKYCCRECYLSAESILQVGQQVFSYENKNIVGTRFFNCILSKGKIIKIYKLNHVSVNGIFQYAIQFDSGNISYRFAHQIFSDKDKCEEYIEKLNRKRQVMRQARDIL